jgi:uncharacterized protein
MMTSELPYDRWLEDALRGVIRRALAYTAEYGLPGAHHFYITFATEAEGVELPPALRAKYPEEMTVVLQHQFWDLTVQDDLVSVTLKFQGRPSRLVIPLSAISAFGDPSVNFGLRLKTVSEEDEEQQTEGVLESAEPAKGEPASGQVIALDTFRKK